jgi:hypothetical protein
MWDSTRKTIAVFPRIFFGMRGDEGSDHRKKENGLTCGLTRMPALPQLGTNTTRTHYGAFANEILKIYSQVYLHICKLFLHALFWILVSLFAALLVISMGIGGREFFAAMAFSVDAVQ